MRPGSALDEREQRYAYVAAGLGAVTSVGLWAPAFGESAGLALAAIGLAMSALLAAAARRRSRLLTGIAAVLLSFGPWGFLWIVGLPYLVLAGWLAVRAPRPEPRAPRTPRPSRRRRQAEDGEDGEDDESVPEPRPRPAAPKASKRYTPPRGRA